MKAFGMFGASIAALVVAGASREMRIDDTRFGISDFVLPGGGGRSIPFGSSKWSVAKDKRRATKRAAIKRARRMGHA